MAVDEDFIVEKLKTKLINRGLSLNIVIYNNWDGYLGLPAGSTKTHIKAAAAALGYQIRREGDFMIELTKKAKRSKTAD